MWASNLELMRTSLNTSVIQSSSTSLWYIRCGFNIMCPEEKMKKFKQTINGDLKLMEIHPKIIVIFFNCPEITVYHA